VAGARLIEDYLAELSRRLPDAVVAELADGIDETYVRYRARGQSTIQAAASTIAEFGDPDVIVEAFVRVSPGRRVAHRLLLSGPAVGGCWALALLAGRAWHWPAPSGAWPLLPAAVLTVVAVLVTASITHRYRLTRMLSVVGCVGLVALDAVMLAYVAIAGPASGWPLLVAMAASAARIAFTASTVPAVVRA
jgi:hypothetical protein